MRVAVYLRVSKNDGSQTVENQRLRCQEVASRNDWSIVQEFQDQMSGSKDTRPGLQDLMKAAWRKEFDVVVVAKLDRIGRSVEHTMKTIRELAESGVGFISCSEAIDTNTAMGKAMLGFLATFAQLERDFIIERTKMGLARVRAQGKKLGPKPLPKEKVAKVQELNKAGKSRKEIASEVGVSPASVSRILTAKYAYFPVENLPLAQPPISENKENTDA